MQAHLAPDPDSSDPSAWPSTAKTSILLVVSGILIVGQMYTVLAMYGPMGATFGESPGAMAWTSTAFGLAYASGFLVAGPMSDRFGPRIMISAGLLVTAIATAVVAAAPNLHVTIALRAVQGASASMFTPAAFSYVASHVRPKYRALVLSCLTSSLLAAAALAQVGAQLIEAAWNWQATFILSAGCLLVVGALAWWTLRPSPASHAVGVAAAFRALPGLLARPRLAVLYLSTATLLGGFVSMYTAIALAGPPSVAGHPGALLALRVSALPAMIAVPLLASWLSRFKSISRGVSGLGLAAAAALSVAVFDNGVVAFGASLLLFVAAIVIAAPALVETIATVAGGNRGAAIALYAFSMFAGASIGGQATSALTAIGFSGIVMIIAAMLVAGAGLAQLSRYIPEGRSAAV
jgi:predicted MFS family arabinose efflux permease